MSIDVATIYAEMVSHARSLGVFTQVLTHEPKSAPGNGLTCVFWLDSVEPVQEVTGLIATSARVAISARIYENFKSQPEDDIDKRLLDATSKLMDAYTGDFQLGGSVMEVDLLGAYGDGLSAKGGYLAQDNSLYRVVNLTIPLIIIDVWAQAA